jgi:hypothetical protein
VRRIVSATAVNAPISAVGLASTRSPLGIAEAGEQDPHLLRAGAAAQPPVTKACATTAALRSGWPVRSPPARFSPVALIRAAVGGVALVLLLRIAEAGVQPAQVILNGSHPGNIFIGGARVPIA